MRRPFPMNTNNIQSLPRYRRRATLMPCSVASAPVAMTCPRIFLVREYPDEIVPRSRPVIPVSAQAGEPDEQDDGGDCRQEAAPTQQMHVLVGIHGAGDSDHAYDDEQVDYGDSRMVTAGANDQRAERHMNATAEKARTLPMAKPFLLRRKPLPNSVKLAAIISKFRACVTVSLPCRPRPIDHSVMKPNACIVSRTKKPETR